MGIFIYALFITELAESRTVNELIKNIIEKLL